MILSIDNILHKKNILLYFIIVFLIYINFSNFFNILYLHISGLTLFSNITPALKDLYMLILLFIGLLLLIKKAKINKNDSVIITLIFLMFGFLIISFILSSASVSFKIYNLRRISTEYLAILTFILLPINTRMYYVLIKTIIYIGVVVSIFGFIEIALPDYFWDKIIGLPEYWNARVYTDTIYSSISEGGGKTYSSDLYFLTGDRIRRLISFYGEATTLGSFITFLFTYVYFSNIFKYRKILLIIFLIAGILIFSKAFFLAIFTVTIYAIIKKPKFYPIVLMNILFILIGYYTYNILGKIHGSLSHIIGLYTGIETSFLHPLGLGLGLAGNRGESVTGVLSGANGAESGIGNVLAQIGFLGFLSVIIIFYILYKFKNLYYATDNQEYFAIFVATVNWYLIYLLSASSLGFSGNIIFFVFIGLMLNRNVFKEHLKKSYFIKEKIK